MFALAWYKLLLLFNHRTMKTSIIDDKLKLLFEFLHRCSIHGEQAFLQVPPGSRLCVSAVAGAAGRDHCFKSCSELPQRSNLSRSTGRGSCYLIAETQNMLSHLNHGCHGLICNKISLIFFFPNVLGILPARRVVLNNLATIEREKENLNKGVKLT